MHVCFFTLSHLGFLLRAARPHLVLLQDHLVNLLPPVLLRLSCCALARPMHAKERDLYLASISVTHAGPRPPGAVNHRDPV